MLRFWETDFLPLLVLARWGAIPVKISTGNTYPKKYQRIPQKIFPVLVLNFGEFSALPYCTGIFIGSELCTQNFTAMVRWPRAVAYFQTKSCKIVSFGVAVSVFSWGGWREGRGGCAQNSGHKHDFCRAQKAGNTDPRTNYAVNYASVSGDPHAMMQNYPAQLTRQYIFWGKHWSA